MRLKNFIMFGKGRGLRLFFWASFVFSCLASLFIYFQLTTFFEMPEVQQFIHKIPVITVENGEIVDPQKTFVQEPIPFVERGMFVLNTLDNPDYTLNFDVGVYLTKNMFYFRNHDNVITETLSNIFGTEPLIISPNMITEQITIDIFVFIAVWFILCIVLSWAIWGVVYLTSWLVLALFDRFVCPCVRARAVSAILPLLLFLCWLVSFFVAVNILTFLILAIILVIIFLWNSPTHSSIMERNLNLLQEETSAPETVVKEETKPVAAPQKKKTTVKSSTQKGKTPVKTQKTKTPVKKTTVKKAPVKTVRRVSDKKAKGKAGILKK